MECPAGWLGTRGAEPGNDLVWEGAGKWSIWQSGRPEGGQL